MKTWLIQRIEAEWKMKGLLNGVCPYLIAVCKCFQRKERREKKQERKEQDTRWSDICTSNFQEFSSNSLKKI